MSERVDTIGLTEKVAEHQRLLHGVDGALGLVAKVEIMWRSSVWIWCTLSALAGSGLTLAIDRLIK